MRAREQADLAAAFQRLPKSMLILAGLKLSFTCGIFFVHAEYASTPVAPTQMICLEREILVARKPFEKIIVHGHTPVKEPDCGKPHQH